MSQPAPLIADRADQYSPVFVDQYSPVFVIFCVYSLTQHITLCLVLVHFANVVLLMHNGCEVTV